MEKTQTIMPLNVLLYSGVDKMPYEVLEVIQQVRRTPTDSQYN